MKNKILTLTASIVALGSFITVATAGEPAAVPEPSMLGLFAGGVAIAVIGLRFFRKK